jgi:hypothetical protein
VASQLAEVFLCLGQLAVFRRVVQQNRLQRFTVPAAKVALRVIVRKIHSIPSIWFRFPLLTAAGSSFIPNERTPMPGLP